MTLLITGANRGVGRALATLAARSGPVLGTYRGGAPAPAPGIEWLPLEVTDPEQHRALALRLAGRPLSLLVCNAGVFLDRGQRLDSGFAAPLWADTFAVNVTGVFLTVQALLPNLRVGRGKIAILSSQMGSDTRAPGGSYIYRASKAAALNLGRNLAADLRAEGIAVGIYHPGWVQTEMGGAGADITAEAAAAGLMARFAALSPETTGCFETWDGRAHPF
ncbi:SDR family NAD(P)-dependent oxidoreductase [Paracoccaceae bacterium Fryx2]|nr:SDR family NAD(P)-dependent oxidoreductase [Paracoccaceae bacterium Fryx2]